MSSPFIMDQIATGVHPNLNEMKEMKKAKTNKILKFKKIKGKYIYFIALKEYYTRARDI